MSHFLYASPVIALLSFYVVWTLSSSGDALNAGLTSIALAGTAAAGLVLTRIGRLIVSGK